VIYSPILYTERQQTGAENVGKLKALNEGQARQSNLYDLRYQIAEADYRNTSFNISIYQVFTIKNIGDTDVFAFYRSPYLTANSDTANYSSVDIGFTKHLWNNQARLRLNPPLFCNKTRAINQVRYMLGPQRRSDY